MVKLARSHGLLPLLHRALSEADAPIAEPARRELEEAARRTLFRDMNLCRELVRVIEALRAAAVVALPFKGPALSAMLWGAPELPQSVDLDVLVLPRDT